MTTVLAEVLARENAALATLDLAAAIALLSDKRAAAEAFARAAAADPGLATPALRDLAAENRRLLERAMAIQSRVLDILAGAVARPTQRYAAAGRLVRETPPVALAARV